MRSEIGQEYLGPRTRKRLNLLSVYHSTLSRTLFVPMEKEEVEEGHEGFPTRIPIDPATNRLSCRMNHGATCPENILLESKMDVQADLFGSRATSSSVVGGLTRRWGIERKCCTYRVERDIVKNSWLQRRNACKFFERFASIIGKSIGI